MTLEHNAFTLADIADCVTPDTLESPGAKFLLSIQDAVTDWASGQYASKEEAPFEIADQAPSIYTHERWQEFTDLAAYQEEPESGEWPEDLTDAAGIALYQIAYRLAQKLIEEIEGDEEE